MPENFIEMEVREIQTSEDPRDLPIIILSEKKGKREFPIFIGHIEANALEDAVVSSSTTLLGFSRRPLTHDLVLNTIESLAGILKRVLITRLDAGTFYGALEVLTSQGKHVQIDSRPSDAMVLAMKRKIPIFVEENVLAEVQRGNFDKPE